MIQWIDNGPVYASDAASRERDAAARLAELEAALLSKAEQAEVFHKEWKQAEAEVAPGPKGGSIAPEVRERLLAHPDFTDYYGYYRSLGWSSKSVDSALSAAKRYFARRGGRLVGQRGRGHRLEFEES